MLNMQNKAAGAVGPAVGRRAEAAAEQRRGRQSDQKTRISMTQSRPSFQVKARRTRQLETDWIGFFSLSNRDVNHFHFYRLPGSFKSSVAPKIDCNTRATHLGLSLQLSRANVRQERAFMNELES